MTSAVTSQGKLRRRAEIRGVAQTNRRRTWILLALVVLLAVACVASLLIGWSWIGPGQVWDSFVHFTGSHEQLVIRESRLQRTVVAALTGAVLGLAGAVMQALTRNPLADPGLLGVNAGAGFTVTVAVFFLGGMDMDRYIWFSLAGAFIATLAVHTIGSLGGRALDPLRVTLAGVAIGTVLMGLSNALVILDPDKFYGTRFWGIGSVANRSFDEVAVVLPLMLTGIGLALAVARPLNALALGEAQAIALGANIRLARLGAIVAVTLLAGTATALVGMIAFVGLMVPHVVRWLVGPDQRWVFPLTTLGAAVLVVIGDTGGRLVLEAGEMPVAIVLGVLGPPALIVLARRDSAVAG